MGLIAEGARVAIVDRSPSALGELQLVRRLGDAAGADAVVAEATEAFGGLDLLVSCAAVARHEPVERLSEAAVSETISSNFEACVWSCRAAHADLVESRGAILIVGSTALYTPAPGESIYRASKAALLAFAQVLAIELAPAGVRVNVLTPGATRTPLTASMTDAQRARLVEEIPLGRESDPEELVPSALLLLSDRLSPYTTGPSSWSTVGSRAGRCGRVEGLIAVNRPATSRHGIRLVSYATAAFRKAQRLNATTAVTRGEVSRVFAHPRATSIVSSSPRTASSSRNLGGQASGCGSPI